MSHSCPVLCGKARLPCMLAELYHIRPGTLWRRMTSEYAHLHPLPTLAFVSIADKILTQYRHIVMPKILSIEMAYYQINGMVEC